jgi:flavin-binding protein dodecin
MWRNRAEDLFAAFVIGNGVLDLIAPRRRVFLWVFGPERLRKLILWFADHPAAMRLRGIARVGLGIGLALRQYRKTPEPSWYQSRFPRYRWALVIAPVGLLGVVLPIVLYRRTKSEAARKKGKTATIARVTELSATSEQSFEAAINRGIQRATSTLRNVESAWIKDMNVMIENGRITAYKVNMAITFVLEGGESPS